MSSDYGEESPSKPGALAVPRPGSDSSGDDAGNVSYSRMAYDQDEVESEDGQSSEEVEEELEGSTKPIIMSFAGATC